jgi:hypothetical protein
VHVNVEMQSSPHTLTLDTTRYLQVSTENSSAEVMENFIFLPLITEP